MRRALGRRWCPALAGGGRFYSTPGKVQVHVQTSDGTRCAFDAPVGVSLMEAIRDVAGLEMSGACDGNMQCATCHVYLATEAPAPSETEQDVLDHVSDPRDTSRLACQIRLTETLDGITAELPKDIRNLML